mmetsp:Transcript_6169/g.9667  ORF Transcript_6169/g.9667 Transcript_6169/m.9667 type:complete len:459 (+) Transcript_6169:33-1409(+)
MEGDLDNESLLLGQDEGVMMESPRTPFMDSPARFIAERFTAGSIKGSIFTLVVAIVGAGTLSVPFAIQQSGLLLGCGLFLAGACLAYFSLELLVISSELCGVKSYKGIADALYGRRMGVFAQVALLCNLYGTSISYIVASGTMISKVLGVIFDSSSIYLGPKYVMAISTCLIILPLCLLRTMGALRYTSLLAVTCVIYLALVVTVMYFDFCGNEEVVRVGDSAEVVTCFWKSGGDPIVFANFDLLRILNTIPIVVYAYTCHPNVLPMFMELQRPTRRRMVKVVGRAIGLACSIYVLLGVFGYLTFKDQLSMSDGNFLNNDYHKNKFILIGAIGMSLSVVLAVPLFVNAFRSNVFQLIHNDDQLDPKTSSLSFHVCVSVGMVVAALLPAILIQDISKVFTVLGSTTNPVICYVLPSLFILRAAPSSMYKVEKFASVLLAVCISIISVISLGTNISKWSK